MDTQQQLHGQFRLVSGAVQKKYGEISDDEIRETEGSLQKLIGLVQEKTGQSREQVESYVNDLADRARAAYEASATMVAKRPAESVFAAFAVGIMTGVALGLSLANRRPNASWRNGPSWRNGWRS